MTPRQEEKLKQLGDRVLDYYENTTGDLVVTMKYGSKYFCRTYIGVRGGMSYQECKVYRNYSKAEGLTRYFFTEYN